MTHPSPWSRKSAATLEERALDVVMTWDAKLASIEQRTIEGHAAITGNLDFNGDVILPGAFTSTVAKGPAAIKVLIGHNYEGLPVGRVLEVREDARGLWTKAQILDTSAGNDLLAVVADAHNHGEAIGMSIGFRVKDYSWVEKDLGRNGGRVMVREIKDLEVREFSYVLFPANPKAVTLGVKAEGGVLTVTIPEGTPPDEARAMLDAALGAREPDPPADPVPALTAEAADLMLADLVLADALSVSKG